MDMVFIVSVMILGLIPGAIAYKKGYNFIAWWLYGAALFIIALPHSILIKSVSMGVCPFCAESIKKEAKVCRYCNRDLPPEWIANSSIINPEIHAGVPEKIGRGLGLFFKYTFIVLVSVIVICTALFFLLKLYQ